MSRIRGMPKRDSISRYAPPSDLYDTIRNPHAFQGNKRREPPSSDKELSGKGSVLGQLVLARAQSCKAISQGAIPFLLVNVGKIICLACMFPLYTLLYDVPKWLFCSLLPLLFDYLKEPFMWVGNLVAQFLSWAAIPLRFVFEIAGSGIRRIFSILQRPVVFVFDYIAYVKQVFMSNLHRPGLWIGTGIDATVDALPLLRAKAGALFNVVWRFVKGGVQGFSAMLRAVFSPLVGVLKPVVAYVLRLLVKAFAFAIVMPCKLFVSQLRVMAAWASAMLAVGMGTVHSFRKRLWGLR